MIAIPKPVRELNEEYLDHVRSLKCVGLYLLSQADRQMHADSCLYLQTQRSEANHIRKACFTGMRTKPNDKGFTLPFCSVLHDLYTKWGHRLFMQRFSLDSKALFDEMKRIEREYDATHQQSRPIVNRQPRTHVGRLQVKCECGLRHSVPVTPALIRNGALHFWCVSQKKNVTIPLRKRA